MHNEFVVGIEQTAVWRVPLSKRQFSGGAKDLVERLGILDALRALDVKGEVVSQDTRSSMKRIVDPRAPDIHYFLKTFDYRKHRKRWRYLLQKSHCRREFENLCLLGKLGVRCPMPIAFGEERSWCRPIAAFLLTEELTEFRELEQVLLGESPPGIKERRLIVGVLARQVALMHNARYIDRDLKFRNILIRAEGNQIELAHVDSTQGKICQGRAFERGVIHDLATLDKHAHKFFSRIERFRFLVTYGIARKLSMADLQLLKGLVWARRQELWRRSGGEPSSDTVG